MTGADVASGLSLADVLGLTITFLSILIAILAVYIAFGFGKKYNEQVDNVKELQKDSEKYRNIIEANVLANKQSIMLMRTTIYHLYKLHDTSNRLSFAKSQLEMIEKTGVWAGKSIDQLEVDKYVERASAEVERLSDQARKIDREVLFLLTDRPNRRTNLNDLIENGDMHTLRLFSELKTLEIDGWNKEELSKAAAQLEYRIKRIRPGEFDAATWTGRS